MKTDTQATDKLEQLVDDFCKSAKEIGDEPTDKQSIQLSAILGMICAFGWVLDCEDDISALLSKMKLGAVVCEMAAKEKS